MNPLMLALMNIGGGAFGGLLGQLFGGGQQRYRQQMMQAASPQHLLALHNMLYNQFLGSPAYTQAAGGAFQRGNALQNNLASSLAARGLGTSGIGSIAGPLAQSSAAGQLGQLRTGAYGAAGQQAGMLQRNELAGLQGAGPPQQNQFAAGLGGGISDFAQLLPYLMGGAGMNAGMPSGALNNLRRGGSDWYTLPQPR